MFDIQIPDTLYVEAQSAAAASGLTVDAYVQEALQLHLEEDGAVRLTAEQVATVRKGQAEIKAGKFLTSDQLKADLAANRSEWLAANPS